LLNADGTELWPAANSVIFSRDDIFLDSLILSLDGSTSTDNVMLGKLMDRVNYLLFFTQHYFDHLFEQLQQNNFKKDESYFELPYDWRFDIQRAALELEYKIEEIKRQYGVEKVDIVAHI